MVRRGENIRKRKDGRWEGRFTIEDMADGKPLYKSVYANSYQEVKKILSANKKKLLNSHKKRSSKNKELIFRDVLYEWLEQTKIKIKQSTYTRYLNLIEKHIIPDVGKFKISEVNNKKLSTLVYKKSRGGRLNGSGGLAPSTINIIIFILKAAVSFAASSNYMEEIQITLQHPKIERKKIKTLSDEEQIRLVEHLKMEMDEGKLGILICLFSGLRLGEICSLSWDDIDLDDRVIFVKKTLQRVQKHELFQLDKTKLVIDSPKSSSSIRQVPISVAICDLLKEWEPKVGYVLSNDINRVVEPRTLQYRFKKILKETDIEDVNFHVLRHTFATRCIKVGFDAKSLSEILGHSNVNITLNRYVHPSMKMKQVQMDSLFSIKQQEVSEDAKQEIG